MSRSASAGSRAAASSRSTARSRRARRRSRCTRSPTRSSAGGIAAFIDAEHALDPEYAQKLGVDIDELLVSQPDTGEQALEIADMLVRSGSIDLIVIDSVAALVPKAEIEGEMGDSHVGLQARLMSQALRKLTGGLNKTNTTMIFINQLREKIGVFFGSPETTAGGKALKFYASVRLDIRRIETLKDGTDAVGNRTRVKVVKNKMAPPFKQAEFDILYGIGISREGSLIDFGVEHEIVKKSGAWYTYDGDQLGQGKENARNFLIKNPDIAAEIEQKIKASSASVGRTRIAKVAGGREPTPPKSTRSRASSRAARPSGRDRQVRRRGARPRRDLPARRRRHRERPAVRQTVGDAAVDDAPRPRSEDRASRREDAAPIGVSLHAAHPARPVTMGAEELLRSQGTRRTTPSPPNSPGSNASASSTTRPSPSTHVRTPARAARASGRSAHGQRAAGARHIAQEHIDAALAGIDGRG